MRYVGDGRTVAGGGTADRDHRPTTATAGDEFKNKFTARSILAMENNRFIPTLLVLFGTICSLSILYDMNTYNR